ncbi:MAG: hypothetical protein ACOYML_13640, partial [Microthrixaceae bacterium]
HQPPTTFTITNDPLGLCDWGLGIWGDSRNQVLQGDFYIGSSMSNELLSPLVRHLPGHTAAGLSAAERPDVSDDEPLDAPEDLDPTSTPVSLGSRR